MAHFWIMLSKVSGSIWKLICSSRRGGLCSRRSSIPYARKWSRVSLSSRSNVAPYCCSTPLFCRMFAVSCAEIDSRVYEFVWPQFLFYGCSQEHFKLLVSSVLKSRKNSSSPNSEAPMAWWLSVITLAHIAQGHGLEPHTNVLTRSKI